MMDEEELRRKWKEKMPGADEGAFERFLASALATILTIIFSWQIIIDVYDDSKRRRQLPDVKSDVTPSTSTPPSANVAFSGQSHNNLTSKPTTSSEPIVPSKSCQNQRPNSLVKEYRLTPGTISRLEAVPDPIELVTHSAQIENNNNANPGFSGSPARRKANPPGTRGGGSLGTCGSEVPVLSDRTVPETDSLDSKPPNRDLLRVLNTRKLLASPDDFDSVPLDSDSNPSSPLTLCDSSKNDISVIQKQHQDCKNSPKVARKRGKMFEESWDMDSSEEDFHEIYGEEDSDRQNPRDFFFMPVDDDEYDSDSENYWPRRMLEAISEEDEDDISSEYESESESDEEGHFSDDSLNVQKPDADDENSPKDQNLNNLKRWSPKKGAIEDYIDGEENTKKTWLEEEESLMDNSKTMDISPEKVRNNSNHEIIVSKDLSAPLSRDPVTVMAALPSSPDDRGRHGNVVSEESAAAAAASRPQEMELDLNRGQKISLLGSADSSDRFSLSPEQTRQLCSSLEGLNRLDPSLCSKTDSGIISRNFYKELSPATSPTPTSMESVKLFNGDSTINISNFDDSKLEFLDESYRDSDLSDCSKPMPRGFIFSRTENLETREIHVSKDFVVRKEEKTEPDVSGGAEPRERQTLSYVGSVYTENQNGGQQPDSDSTREHNQQNLNSNSIKTVENDSVYVIELDNSFTKTEDSDNLKDKFTNQTDEENNIESEIITPDHVREVKSGLLDISEPILDQKTASISTENNSSGDESSTTTGETAILNPGNREITDDDVSEISEIDIDVINELSIVASDFTRPSKSTKVTDLDASSSSESETSEHSEENSDSSASFEFNEDRIKAPEPEVPPNRNRNLEVLDELEEEELSTSDSDSEEFKEAPESLDTRKLSLKDLASSGSGSSPDEVEFSDPSLIVVTKPGVGQNSEHSDPVRSHTIEPLLTDKSHVGVVEANLSISPYFSTAPDTLSADTTASPRSILKRSRHYSDSGESYPELGFFTKPETEEFGTQTIRSFRQPAKCTIDPERYFRPFKVDSTVFNVTTEFSNGDIEVRKFADVGVQIRFDPLWDKHDTQLVLSPSATPPRGSPVTVEKDGKIQPKELIFQWPDKEEPSDSVFSDNLSFSDNPALNLDSTSGLNLAKIDASRRRRPSTERRASYDAIEESEEDLLEESNSILDLPPKGTPTKGKKPDLRISPPPKIEEKVPEKLEMETKFGSEVVEFTAISCKGFDHPSPPHSGNEMEAPMQSERKVASETKPEVPKSKARTEPDSSDSETESAAREPRSPPKRRHRKAKESPQNSLKISSHNSSSDEGGENHPILERVHIEDSSDADDESDEEARVPLFHRSASPLLSSPMEPKWSAAPDKWVTTEKSTEKWIAPTDAFIEPISTRISPRNSPQTKSDSPRSPRISISPRPRPVPQPRVKTSEFISSTRVSPPEVKPVLYNQFSRPKSPGSKNLDAKIQNLEIKLPLKSPVSPTESPITTMPAPRVQSAMNVQLSSVSMSSPIPSFGTKVETTKSNPNFGAKIEPPKTSTNFGAKIEPLKPRPQTLDTSKPDDKKIYAQVPVEPKKYQSALIEPISKENKNISHLFTLPDKTIQPDREKILNARKDYMKSQEELIAKNEEERKKILSKLLGTRDWSEREMPKPKSILKKPSPSFETKQEDLPLGYRPTSLDTPNLEKMCKSTENIKERISRVVERQKQEDRERSRSRSNSRGSELGSHNPEFERGRPERRSMTLPFNTSTRAKSLDSLLDNKSMSLPRSDSKGNLHRSPSISLNKEPLSFFSDRKSYTNLLETDIDNDQQAAVPLIKETDLDKVQTNLSTQGLYRTRSKSETREIRPVVKEVYDDRLEKTKSMELLSDGKTIEMTAFGGTPEVVPVSKESSRLSKSLGQLDLPDWYVNAPRKVEDVDFGLQCTKAHDSSQSTSFDHSKSFRSTNTSFDATSPRSTVLTTRVSPPRRTPSPKPLKNFELPSEKFRRTNVPLANRRIVSKMRPPGSKSEDNLTTKGLVAVDINLDEHRKKSDGLSPFSFSKEKETPKTKPEVPKTRTIISKTEDEMPKYDFMNLESKPEVEVKKTEVAIAETEPTKPEGRFKSSATLQLKPATPPKPLARPPPPPKPEVKPMKISTVSVETKIQPTTLTTVLRSEPKTLFGDKVVPFGAPPPVPESPKKEESKVEEPPKLEEPKVSIFDLPFVDDESPQDEENLMSFNSPVTPEPKTQMAAQKWVPEIPRRTTPPKEREVFIPPPKIQSAPTVAQTFIEPPKMAPKFELKTRVHSPETEMIFEPPKVYKAPNQPEVFMEPPNSSFSMEAPKREFVIEAPKELKTEQPKEFYVEPPKAFSVDAPKPFEANIQPPRGTTFNPPTQSFAPTNPFAMKETTFEVETKPTVFKIEKPKETTFEIQAPKDTTFEIEAPKETTFEIQAPKETTFEIQQPSETQLRLQAPTVQAACQPLQSKTFSTTPTQFYALNCIDTDFDTSATMSPPLVRGRLKSDDLSGSDSAKENQQPLERKWAPQEANVGVQFRRNGSNPVPIETNIDAQRSPRLIDEPTPRSPRETSFVSSKPSPKIEGPSPSSPRETSFLSKGKERSHFVFPKPVQKETSFGQKEVPKETSFGAQETNIDAPYQPPSRRPYDFRQPQVPESRTPQQPQSVRAPINGNQYQTPKPLSTFQRPQIQPMETCIDSSPMIKRNERHPPTRPEPSPIQGQGQGRPGSGSNDSGWKTSTPIVRAQNYPRNTRLPSRETNIDGDIVQQPKSPALQFERSLDNDSFRFNAPQSESTPLNLSLESNSSIRGQLRNNQVPRPRVETDIDADLRTSQGKRVPPAPPVRKSSVDRAPLLRGGNPRSFETDIDSDLSSSKDQYVRPMYQNGPRQNGPRNAQSSYPSRQSSINSRPGSVTSHTSDGYFDPGDLETFKRLAREDPLVSTSSPRATPSPLDANFNAFGQPIFPNSFASNVRIDHSKNVYQPKNSVPESPSDPESPHNTSLVEVLDGLLGMEDSPRQNNSDDYSDPHKKRTISEAKFDIFNDINKKLNEDVTFVKCRNSKCGKTLPMREARTVFVSCSICYCYYCSEECRSKHYPRHEQRCTFSRVENSCKLVARKLKTDKALSPQLSGVARTAYHSQGRGCVAIVLESPLQCDQVVNSGRSALASQPKFCTMNELDSDPKIADNAMDLVVDYNPNTDYVLNICCKVNRRTTEFVRYCEIAHLTVPQTPTISVNDKQPREQWFYSIQDKLRERGVDLRRQYPDVYNQIIQYVDRKLPFQSITIYPVDGNTGRTFLCSISPDMPVDIRAMSWNKPQMGRAPPGPRTPLGAPVGPPRRAPQGGAPMYQPPRRAPNVASKETEL